MIDQYDDRDALQLTNFGERVMEDAEEEDEVDNNTHGLFPNTCRTLFQDKGRAGTEEMEEVPALFSDSDDEVLHKVPKPSPFRYMCSKCDKPYKQKKSMVTHQAKCENLQQAKRDYNARRRREEDSNEHSARRDCNTEARATSRREEGSNAHDARRDRDTEARANSRREEDSNAHDARRDRDTEARANSRREEDSNAHSARRDRDTEARANSRREESDELCISRLAKDNEATNEARRLARKSVLEACGVSASGHENDAINQDAENFHCFTLKSLRFVTCACCAREDGNGKMVQRATVSNDEHLIAIRHMRELHAEVAENPWDHVRYQDLDIDGLLPKKQKIGLDDAESVEGVAFRKNDFICDKCVKALKKGSADFIKLAEDERPKLPIGMQGNFFQPTLCPTLKP
jgi:hypothetical protein